MTRKQTLMVQVLLVALSFGVAAWLYPSLPQRMPIHWNAAGHPNNFADKSFGAFIMPGMAAVMFILALVLPRISPQKFELSSFRQTYDVIMTATLALLVALTTVVLMAARDTAFDVNEAVLVSLGAFFVVFGNFLGKVRKNFFVGIRTPWTLASDEVWLRTHRMGGKLMVAAGFLTAIAALQGLPVLWALTPILAASAVCAVYSYVIYARLQPTTGASS